MLKRCVLAIALVTGFSASGAAQQVYDAGNGVTLPAVVKEVKPTASIDATVLLECVVLADGNVGDVKVAASGGTEADAAAVEAMKQWQFEPGTKGGEPVAVRIHVEFTFAMK